MEEPTKEKVLLALEPSVVMAAMHTTIMSASITAYSTAVGPSSAFRNDTSFLATFRMSVLPNRVFMFGAAAPVVGNRTGLHWHSGWPLVGVTVVRCWYTFLEARMSGGGGI